MIIILSKTLENYQIGTPTSSYLPNIQQTLLIANLHDTGNIDVLCRILAYIADVTQILEKDKKKERYCNRKLQLKDCGRRKREEREIDGGRSKEKELRS